MTRIATTRPMNSPAPQPADRPATASRGAKDRRETVESVVVAIILALLVRGFLAEAFVIPTGSMSPTLNGRLKDVHCPQCGFLFQVNAADEANANVRIKTAVCGNCRFQSRVDDEPTFKGDRILVMKFPYSLPWLPGSGGPRRWDVVVFHYPEKPDEQNYIKRLVGRPDEDLRILAGDILTRKHGDAQAPFRLERKPLNHLKAMLVPVYDDSDRAEALADNPEWSRWIPRTPAAWAEGPVGTYTAATAAPGGEWSSLRYRNRIPDPAQWEALIAKAPLASPPRTTLITDFNSYNTGSTAEGRDGDDGLEPHWVGDLAVEFALEVTSDSGRIRLELVRGGVPYRCEVDLATGLGTLSADGKPLGTAVATGIKGAGKHQIAFANVDGRLTLWVDGATPFGEGLVHDDGTAPRPVPKAGDLDPVGIATRGAGARVSGLVLKRDIYYTLAPSVADYGSLGEALGPDFGGPRKSVAVSELLSAPSRFAALGKFAPRDFSIAPGHYMMMGDNSPRSSDGRAWGNADRAWANAPRATHEVPESLLIGKAFLVYWPHGKPIWPNLRINQDFRFPFLPNFARMKWIR